MDRQSKELTDLEAYCRGGQGPPRDIAPSGGGLNNGMAPIKKKKKTRNGVLLRNASLAAARTTSRRKSFLGRKAAGFINDKQPASITLEELEKEERGRR